MALKNTPNSEVYLLNLGQKISGLGHQATNSFKTKAPEILDMLQWKYNRIFDAMNISTASLTTERKWRCATGYDEKRFRKFSRGTLLSSKKMVKVL
jgi:hypothetical protein